MHALSRRQLLLLGLGLTASTLPITGQAQVAVPPGARSIDLDWIDTHRDRPVPARLHLPADGPEPAPLLLFSPGLFGLREGYSWIGRALASQGVACLHVQHVGSDRRLLGSHWLLRWWRVLQAVGEAEALARVQDLRHALDRLLADPGLGPRIDARRIVGAGHSYGATTMMLAAGAGIRRDERILPLRDERLRALIMLSAPPFYGEGPPEPILAPVQLPSLHVTTTEDTIEIPGYRSPPEDRLAVFEAIGSLRKVLAVFNGGGHSIFTDRTTPGGPVLNARVKQATQDLMLAFLREVLAPCDPPGTALGPWHVRHAADLARFDLHGIPALT